MCGAPSEGLRLALAAGRLLESMLAGVKPWDPAVVAGAVLLSLTTALAGGWLPTIRAARVDPTTALRAE